MISSIICYIFLILCIIVCYNIIEVKFLFNIELSYTSLLYFLTLTKDPAYLMIGVSIGFILIASNKSLLNKLDGATIILFLTGFIGLLVVIVTNNILELYVGLEIIGLSFYVLACRERKSIKSTEAGLKYFIIGALSSGFILLGVSILYQQTGIFELDSILRIESPISWLLIKVGLLFKLGAAPFHMWVPDIYEGSPTIIAMYLAIVPKISYMSVLIRTVDNYSFDLILLISGVFSLFVGGLGALNQNSIKRIIGYSAIGHVGFMLLSLSQLNSIGFHASLLYLIIYTIMTINIFLIVLKYKYIKILELRGLSRRNNVIGLTLGLSFMSIAGIPPLSGFFNKLIVLDSLINQQFLVLSFFIVIISVISVFYYLTITR